MLLQLLVKPDILTKYTTGTNLTKGYDKKQELFESK